MMFPTANSTIIRNEDGEVLGWDDHTYDEPNYDPEDYHRQYDEYEAADTDTCINDRMHGRDGDGTDETCAITGETVYECEYCGGKYIINDAGDSLGPDARGLYVIKIDN